MKAKMIDKNNSIGIAGEFFVAAELTRRGYVASLTGKNTKDIDILVSNKDGSKSLAIQVKTSNSLKFNRWMMTKKVEDNFNDNLFYVLVNMNEGNMPSYYVIPSKLVAQKIKKEHKCWLETPGVDGKKRNDTTMRVFTFVDDEEKQKYYNAWDLLGI